MYNVNVRQQLDGLALLRSLPDGIVSAVVFDPQYRQIMDKMKYGNEGARQKQRALLPQMPEPLIIEFLSEIERVLKPSGHLLFWMDKLIACERLPVLFPHIYLPVPEDKAEKRAFNKMQAGKLMIVDNLVWSKGYIGQGHRTRRSFETMMILQKPPKRARGVWIDRGIPDVVLEKVPLALRKIHPHTKPIGITTRILKSITKGGDLVVDPAAGSYVTLDAVKSLENRIFLGGDLVG